MRSRLRLLLLLVCLLVAMALGLYGLSQSPSVRARVLVWTEGVLTDALGREVRVAAVDLQLWKGSLELAELRVARAKTLADGVLFSAETIRIRWGWSALLRRQLTLRQITLIRPRLTLPTKATPELTVQDILPLLFQSRGLVGRGWVLRVQRASWRDGHLAWMESGGQQGALEGFEGNLRWIWASGGDVSTMGTLRAIRLTTTRGETIRQFDRLSLQLSGTGDALSVSAAEFSMADTSVTARGRITDLAHAPLLELDLGLQSSLHSLLLAFGIDRQMEGTVAVKGRLQGAWGQPVFRGEGSMGFAGGRKRGEPFRFSLHWESGRLEAETLSRPTGTNGSFDGKLELEPATGLFRLRAGLRDTDLTALPGLPAAVAAQLGVHLPPDVRGRVTGAVDLTGRGIDIAALRGQINLVARDLGLEGETPDGRLEARLTATASRVDVEAFTLQLPGGDITGRGGLTFATGNLDLPMRAEIRDVSAFARGFGLRFLGGGATLQGRVIGTQRDPSFQGRISWREARIAGHPVDLIEGDVEVTRRALRTSHATVRSGQSTAVLRGSLVATGAAPLRQLNPMQDLVLDLQLQVNPGHTDDLTGLLPEDVEVQGAFRAAGWIKGSLRELTGEVGVTFENVRTWEETWGRGEGQFRLRPGDVDIGRIVLRRGAEQLTGGIGIGTGGALRGRLTSTIMDVAKVGMLSGSQLGGRASFRLDFQGTLRDTVTLGQATVRALSYRGIPIGPGTATFRVEHKAVDVDLTCRNGTHRLQLSVGPPGDRSVKGELTLSQADLDLVARVGEIETLRAYRPHGSGRIRFGGPARTSAFANGEADLTSLRLQVAGETLEGQGTVQASWSGPTMSLRQLRLRSGNQEFEVRGTVGDGGQTDLTVSGQIPLRLLDDYLPSVHITTGLVNANLRVRGDREAPTFDGTLAIRQGQVIVPGLPMDFQEVQAGLAFQGSRAQIREWRGRLAEGDFEASGEIGLNGERWDFRLTFQEDKGRAEQLLRKLYGGKGEVTGQLFLGGQLTSQGEDAADFWRNLGGQLKLVLQDGRIGRYTVTAKILTLLNVAHLMNPNGTDLTAEGMPYQRLTADIKIAEGIARTDNLVLDSRAMKISAVGTVNFAEDTVDLTVAARPFQNVDRVLTAIPLAGWLLGGKEKSILVAYYRVTGSLRDPQVTAIPLRSVGRNVFGIFRNLLEIPETLTGPYGDLPPQQVKPEEGEGR